MIARKVFYIKSESQGRFVGECMGMGFFESHIEDGTLSKEHEAPIQFETREQAEEWLNHWVGGKGDCFVEEGIG